MDAQNPTPSRWAKIRLVIKVVELRLRFVALMTITGLTFAYWDTLGNLYDKWIRPHAHEHVAVSGIEYYCPMHPQVVQADKGSCPICGMPLAKRKAGEKATLPAGVLSRVELASFRVSQAGIKTVEVAYAPLNETIRTVGSVAFDERKLATIVSKVPGRSRVEALHVNVTGQRVQANQPLAELYSPELNQAIVELLNVTARANHEVAPQTEVGKSLMEGRRELARASIEKLQRWGITQPQIDEILAKRKTNFTFTILSPIAGYVIKKNVVEGQEVQEGFPMFEVADMSTVWIQAQVYEHQIGMIREGLKAQAHVEAFPSESFPGTLEFIQPRLDPSTRTVEVRFALDNAQGKLRPGMYASVDVNIAVAELPEFKSRLARHDAKQENCPVTNLKLGTMGDPVSVDLANRKVLICCASCTSKLKAQPAKYLARLETAPRDEVLTIPEAAVIDTGVRKVVYVETEPGVFEGREVVLGPRVGDRFPVLSGLSLSDRVAASGAFLIDAESRLNPGAAPAPAHDHPPAKAEEKPLRSAILTDDDKIVR